MHKTSAWPLSQAYAALIVYASLYPFTGWRDQGIAPWEFLWSPLPKYWTGFDVAANAGGYVPLGFLLALSFVRRGGQSPVPTGRMAAIAVATLTAAALALVDGGAADLSAVARALERGFRPQRSRARWLGAVVAAALEMAGAIDHWSRFRVRWFVADARGALVLLALWPFALLFPAAVPFGLGQVFERMEAALADWLLDTPFLEWLPVRDVELQPLVPGAELICVALGALIPCLLGYSVIQSMARRAVFALAAIAVGVGATALSAALSWGPVHAWAWLSLPVQLGLLVGMVLAVALLPAPRRACAALVLAGAGACT